MASRTHVQISLSVLIAGIVLGTAVLLVTALLLVVKHESDATALESAEQLFSEISQKTLATVNTVLRSTATLADTAVLTFDKGRGGAAAEGELQAMRSLLQDNPHLLSVYIGEEDGAFRQLVAVRGNEFVVESYGAPPGTEYVHRDLGGLQAGPRNEARRFLDAGLRELGAPGAVGTSYDPRVRPWYEQARQSGRSVFTMPYVFSSSRLPGLTCARVLPDGSGVFGADVTLASLGEMLATQKVAESGTLWIVDAQKRLVAYPGLAWGSVIGEDLQLPAAEQADNPLVREVARVPDGGSGPFFVTVNGEVYLADLATMPEEYGLALTVAVAAPLREIMGYIGRMALRIVLIAGGLLLLIVPVAVFMARRTSRPVGELVREAEKIQRYDFSPSEPIVSHVREVQELAAACEVMKNSLRDKTEGLERTREKLELLLQGGLALSAEKELSRLVTLIFQTARTLAQADGGVLYLFEGDALGVEMLALQGESVVLGGLSGNPAPRVMVRPAIMAFLSQDSVLRFACEAFNGRKTVYVQGRELSLFPTGLPEEPKDYPIRSLVAVPIVTRRDEVLGVIQLFNPHVDETDSAGAQHLEAFIGALAAQAAVTLDNRNLVLSLQELFDALIKVIATSVDSKSPYTAGHCTRVPLLAEMLAKAAHETQEGPLRDFSLDGEDDWRQLWIAAWLHDCGKVTTPEHVVDKATKLETVYNRIHELRMRFEVLRRDAELDYYRRLAAGGEDPEALRQALEEAYQGLEEDFRFVARCNVGGEFMTAADKERLERIAGRTWLRHYSDRLGISEDELRGRGEASEPPLPVTEPLLADKPEHLKPRFKDYSHLQDAQGRPVEAPEHEYNRGELYNLCISRGTLTAEERFKINEHTLNGLEMLAQIPFPDGLRRVVEIATAHHETLVGTGYPLRKSKEQLSVEARILAIADIFEALTASDRPYKKAKTLSESLRIMSFMRNDQHIDADLFDIFLEKGVFKQYAAQHLHPEQDDVSDIAGYLNGTTRR